MVTDIIKTTNAFVTAEVVRKKMNKSLILELFISFIPFIVATFCAAVIFIVIEKEEPTVITWAIIFILSMILCVIIKIIITLEAMNYCIEYFSANSDTVFVNKCSNSKTWYIISYIMPFVPIINIFTIFVTIYNLIVWLSVKNRISAIEYVKADASRDINSCPSSTGTTILIFFLIISGLGLIGLTALGIISAIALPAYANYMARARFIEVTNAVSGVQKQVELCIFDLGVYDFEPNQPIVVDKSSNYKGCSNIYGSNRGNGWKISNPFDYATKYVNNISVTEDGVITAEAVASNGLNSATIQFIPHFGTVDNGVVVWRRNNNVSVSTCIATELC